jgi:HK97 family phage prohead protease
METRRLPLTHLRAQPDEGEGTIDARITTFGNTYEVGHGARERIMRGAFRSSIGSKLPCYGQHGHARGQAPIGIADQIREDEHGVRARIRLYVEDHADARAFYRAVRDGAELGHSIGFLPEEVREGHDGAEEIVRGRLVETSLVLLGANPEAKTLAVRARGRRDGRHEPLSRAWYRDLLRAEHEVGAARRSA